MPKRPANCLPSRTCSYEGRGAVSEEQTLAVEVSAIERLTPLIKHFTLAPVGGGSMPAFSGGSHIVVVMGGVARGLALHARSGHGGHTSRDRPSGELVRARQDCAQTRAHRRRDRHHAVLGAARGSASGP